MRGNGHLQLLIYCLIALQSGCANLHSSQQRWGVPAVPRASRPLMFSDPMFSDSMFCQSDGCEMVSLWFKMCTFLFTNEAGHFSCVYCAGLFLIQGPLGRFSSTWKSGLHWFCLKIEKRSTQGQTGETKEQIDNGRDGMEDRGPWSDSKGLKTCCGKTTD